MKLYLVRHTQPLVEAGICYGASDVLCSDEAMLEAALQLLKILPKQQRILSSPLSRCERFAQILCGLEPSFAYKTDPRLAEMHFGAWEMQPWASIAVDELTAWTDRFAAYRCGGAGQSTAQFVQRVAQRLFESAQEGQDQIWITHAGVIRALQWLRSQSFELLTDLVRQPDPEPPLGCLRASDWPTGEVAFGQLHSGRAWEWPASWPTGWASKAQSLAEQRPDLAK